MPQFRYRALDASGQMVVGVIEAPSTEAVAPELEKIAYLPIEISDAAQARSSFRQLFARRPTSEEISGVTEDLATLVKGGLTLDRALLVLSETGARPAVSQLMLELHRGISAGHSLAESVSAHPELFPKTYVKMVEVAEVAGTLDETLRDIAHERRRSEHLRRRISSALTYPAFLTVAAVGVLAFVLLKIIPEFERAMQGFYAEGQQPDQMVFALSRMVRANADLLGVAGIILLTGLFFAARSGAVKSFLLRVVGRMPGIREVVRHEQTVAFCATLGTLTNSGVDITTSLRLIRDLMRNRRSAEKIERVVTSVRQGHRLSEALLEVDLLPIYAVHMLRVGEESGELHSAAMRIAGFYEARLDRALTRLTSVLGPAIIILVSLLIAWLIISVITALLSVNELLL
jgi:general secretion pathway protein F